MENEIKSTNTEKIQLTKHPLIIEANKLYSLGRPIDAAKTILKVSAATKDSKIKARILIAAANFLKIVLHDKSIELARKSTNLDPNSPLTWLNLSLILYEKKLKKNKEEAINALDTAINLNPVPHVLVDIGRHYSVLGLDKKALDCVKKGIESSNNALGLLSYALRVALQYADWELSDNIIKCISEAYKENKFEEVSETPRTHLLWCSDESINLKVISNFAKKAYPERPEIKKNDFKVNRLENKKIRVGYISYDFREHATSLLALGLLRHHNKEYFETFAYCCSYDDGSALRRDILSKFNHGRTFAKLSDKKAAEIITKDRIDILVDLNGLTEGSRLGILAYKPAPIQISYLAFPGTAGGRFIDYIIADNYILPEDIKKLYPEKIINIPYTYQINDYRAKYLPPKTPKKLLPINQEALVLGMFNNINKVNPVVWDVWMKILKLTPNSILWMLDPGLVAQDNLIKESNKRGISSERILFAPKAPQEQHFGRLQNCDLILDPWPYGGHTTTSDALFAGCPVVALEGKNFASRVSGGLLKAARLDNLIAKNIEDYINITVSLLKNKNELISMKKNLLKNRFNLDIFNSPMRTLYIEAAYFHLIKQTLNEMPCKHFTVENNLTIKE